MKNDYVKQTDENSLFKGKVFEVIEATVEYRKNGKEGTYYPEIARRAPGVRVLILNEKEKKILLSKENRYEIKGWDYRLPGGKVFDKLVDYLKYKDNEDELMKYVEEAVISETKEEVKIIANNHIFLHKSIAGGSVIWDLYYYLVTDYSILEPDKEIKTEEIIYPEWFFIEDVKEMCLNGKIQEDRSAAVLLRYLLKNNL